ncbi:MAG: tRNA preQ1(34) S-adenosylmethionine ribosyltransferase-isomerase QueA [Bacillota bacterium]|nr:tRNA preQ1(34) S-adenosylmethionine ribosyltransferase-isomerase QueA [Bacillota bacterium]
MTDVMRTSDFSYTLPDELIAQHPLADRDESRLLVLTADALRAEDRFFRELPELLRPGDLLVLNDSRVRPSRLLGQRPNGGAAEVFLLEPESETDWVCLVRPGRRLRTGATVNFAEHHLSAKIVTELPEGRRLVRFSHPTDVRGALAAAGQVPLPPYIHEKLDDPERYQTVYARTSGSAAAPTAGLHFTTGLLERLAACGVEQTTLTLHVGLGTFRPVQTERVEEHVMHSEHYEVSAATAEALNRARRQGRRIVAVGTTSCRVLESIAARWDQGDGEFRAERGETSIFIYPGFQFRVVDALITNFHLPQSTLLMLVSAFAGRERVLAAYQHAIQARYRFYSFGDAMFLTRRPDPFPEENSDEPCRSL